MGVPEKAALVVADFSAGENALLLAFDLFGILFDREEEHTTIKARRQHDRLPIGVVGRELLLEALGQ